MDNKQFITYGFHIDRESFETPRNGSKTYMNKPSGGLWASPSDSHWDYKNWCERNEAMDYCDFDVFTKFTLKSEARVMVIDSHKDLIKYMEKYGRFKDYDFTKTFDWNKIIKDFDAVYLTAKGNFECHLPDEPRYPNLYMWDCESIVILNFDIIEIVEFSK